MRVGNICLAVLMGLLALTATAESAKGTAVTFGDPKLEMAVRSTLGIGVPPTTTDMAGLAGLIVVGQGINSLVGLETAINLQVLDISYNHISDLSPLTGLPLVSLTAQFTAISDLSPLTDMTTLSLLRLDSNPLGSLAPLSSLSGLVQLSLASCGVSDYTSIGGLTSLVDLDVSFNGPASLGPIGNLTSLSILRIAGNQLTSIAALSPLTSLTTLDISRNMISDLSPLAGATILLEFRAEFNNITDISVLSTKTFLRVVTLNSNAISDVGAIENKSMLQELGLAYTGVTDLSFISALPSLIHLDISGIGGTNLNAVGGTSLQVLIARDNAINDTTAITSAFSLTTLDLTDNAITSLVDIGGLSNLQHLAIGGNDFTSLDALGSITGLEVLEVQNPDPGDTRVTDISALSGMGLLEYLDLQGNAVTDISALNSKLLLQSLDLDENPVSDFSPLSTLPALRELIVDNTGFSDLTTLSGLSALNFLSAENCLISNLGPLTGLVNLSLLYLGQNSITDVTPLNTLSLLRELELSGNGIVNITPLSSLGLLQYLSLEDNQVVDITALATMPFLMDVELGSNQIVDITPLVSNAGIGAGDTIFLSNNPLSAQSICADVNTLQVRGATVIADATCGDDDDGDGIPNGVEGIGDFDNDGVPNYLDDDSDGDGVLDIVEGSLDTDSDGAMNFLDRDSDNDGIEDGVEEANGLNRLDANDALGDPDGDGVPTIIEVNILNSDPAHPDTDRDGMPDGFEGLYKLDPLNPADGDLDSDRDGLTNREEAQRRSNPRDASSPVSAIFVSPTGNDTTAIGAAFDPLATIAAAQQRLNASVVNPGTIVLLPGSYTENVVLNPGESLFGAKGVKPILVGRVTMAEESRLANVNLQQSVANGVAPLISLPGVDCTIARVTITGGLLRDATGVLATGDASGAVIADSVISSLDIGVDSGAALPVIRRTLFENLATSALVVRAGKGPGGSNSFGAAEDPNSGHNTFRNISGPVVDNESGQLIRMENNDWDTEDEMAIAALIEGPTDFSPALAKNGILSTMTVVVSVWDRESLAPVTTASVTVGGVTVTRNSRGAYTFASLPQGTYDLDVTATNYVMVSDTVSGLGGQAVSASAPLTPLPVVTDSDGDGLTDSDEVNIYFTNPNEADSDGDGVNDDVEIAYGTNPNTPDNQSPADVTADGKLNSSDVQLVINAVLGLAGIEADVDIDGDTDSTDIQLVINALLGI